MDSLVRRSVNEQNLDTTYGSLAKRLPKFKQYLNTNNPIEEILSKDKSVKKIIDLFHNIFTINLWAKDELLMNLAKEAFRVLSSEDYDQLKFSRDIAAITTVYTSTIIIFGVNDDEGKASPKSIDLSEMHNELGIIRVTDLEYASKTLGKFGVHNKNDLERVKEEIAQQRSELQRAEFRFNLSDDEVRQLTIISNNVDKCSKKVMTRGKHVLGNFRDALLSFADKGDLSIKLPKLPHLGHGMISQPNTVGEIFSVLEDRQNVLWVIDRNQEHFSEEKSVERSAIKAKVKTSKCESLTKLFTLFFSKQNYQQVTEADELNCTPTMRKLIEDSEQENRRKISRDRRELEEASKASKTIPEAIRYLKDTYGERISLFKEHVERLRELDKQEKCLDEALAVFNKHNEALPE